MSSDQPFTDGFYETAKQLGMDPEELFKSQKIQESIAALCRQVCTATRALHEALLRQSGDVAPQDAKELADLINADLVDISTRSLVQSQELGMESLPHVAAVCTIAATAEHLKRLSGACIDKFQGDIERATDDE